MARMRTRFVAGLGVVIGLAVAGVTVMAGTASSSGTRAADTGFVLSPTLAKIKSSGQLRACIDPEFPPEVYTKNGQPAGLDVALTQVLAASLSANVVWVTSSFDGLIAGLQADKCDISLSGMTPRGKRALSVSFAKPTLAAVEGVVVKKTDTRTTFAALNKPSVKFCAQTGTGSDFDQKKYFPKAKVVEGPELRGLPAPARLGQVRRDDHRLGHRRRLDQGAEVAQADPDRQRPPGRAHLGRRPAGRSRLRRLHRRVLRRVHQQRRLRDHVPQGDGLPSRPERAPEAARQLLTAHGAVPYGRPGTVPLAVAPYGAAANGTVARVTTRRQGRRGPVSSESEPATVTPGPATRPPADPERVVMRAVEKSYGTSEILRGVSLEVARGEVVVIIGSSGSGKTTLLRCVAGLEPIQGGEIHVFGARVRNTWNLHGEVGFVFQHFNLFPQMTALENVMLALVKVRKMRRGPARELARESLALVGMDAFADARPARLSGGQQQRVAIARSLAMKPTLMLFDEATSALDRELVREVLAVMQKLAEQHMTMMVVSHELAFAEQVAHRVVYMDEGEIVEMGTAEEVLHRPVKPRTREFLGQITIDLHETAEEA